MIRKHSIIWLIVLCFLSCKTDTQSKINTDLVKGIDQNLEVIINDENGFFFKGNMIHINNEESDQMQEIEMKKEDLVFRAKKISSESYLKRKGLSGKKLKEALNETNGEQLFYIEFEEEMKLNLVKKYFKNDLDKNIAYFSFGIHNDFQIINSYGDTLNSSYSLYEQNYSVAPFERLLLSFSGINQQEELKLVYQDNLFGKGQIEFHFAPDMYIINNTKIPA